MTKIKLCGMTRLCDIEKANELKPDYIGFVFCPKSRRYVTPAQAAELKAVLDPDIRAVGVFVNEAPEKIAELLRQGVIDLAQLHGCEDEAYIRRLRSLTDSPLIQAFRIETEKDAEAANRSSADLVLLDSGSGGTGSRFDWDLLRNIRRPYFLAGGLNPDNIREAVRQLHPYGADVSSGIETDGRKDPARMEQFVSIIRKEDRT